MTFRIRRTKAAREDLMNIARYTRDMWGDEQLQIYMHELETRISTLTDKPQTAGQDASYLVPGLGRLTHHDHYGIFYRINGSDIEIMRVLHLRRNWQRILLVTSDH
uniref:type II toxin-antitoxin system RelE/ParE family toxin n=1 Tax=Pararhizobium sp. IMCC3301 TaxID=3067904 RepID=UPI00274217C1|nr:type II toxin-antitoxin system RelE/ParE family toxin [Pararhizobium sp. IMCC3301]